jgi:hypothetical protein
VAFEDGMAGTCPTIATFLPTAVWMHCPQFGGKPEQPVTLTVTLP